MRYFWLLVLGIFVYRFVTRFVVPIAKVTRNTSRRMREMQEAMRQQQSRAAQPEQKPIEGTYIDYEEVK